MILLFTIVTQLDLANEPPLFIIFIITLTLYTADNKHAFQPTINNMKPFICVRLLILSTEYKYNSN